MKYGLCQAIIRLTKKSPILYPMNTGSVWYSLPSAAAKNSVFQILNTAGRGPLTQVIPFLYCMRVTRIHSFILSWGKIPWETLIPGTNRNRLLPDAVFLFAAGKDVLLWNCVKKWTGNTDLFFLPFTFLLPVYHPVISENSYRKAFFRMDNFHLRFFPI